MMIAPILTWAEQVERLGRAFHEVSSRGGPLHPCGHPDPENENEWVRVEYNGGNPGDYDCLCESIASAILTVMKP